jgi:hypothetical protein
MNSQELRALQEAYVDVYGESYKDLGDKARNRGHQLLDKSKTTATRGSIYSGVKPSNTPEGEKLQNRASQQFAVSAFHNPEKAQAKSAANKARGEKQKKAFGNRLTRSDKQGIQDSYDLYDIILSHLLDEGYADTEQAAEVIMVNMSEDWRESIVEGMDMKDFKANRRNIKRREASADAKSRGHVSKNIVTHGKTYSSDEAKAGRANMSDNERATRKSVAMNPDQVGDTRETADKTKNTNKLRKQKAMGELGEEYKKLPVGKMLNQAARQGKPEQVAKMGKVADDHNPVKAKRKEADNRREGGRKRDAGRPRSNELQDNW